MRHYITPFFISLFIFCGTIVAKEVYMKNFSPVEMMNEENIKFVSNPPCIELNSAIDKYAEVYKIPKRFAYAIAYSETRYGGPFDWGYDHRQTSPLGALGPMQVMYSTAKLLFPNKQFTEKYLKDNIDFNVECSLKLLSVLFVKYNNWKVVFGAYNTGKPIINQYAENVYNFKMTNIRKEQK